MSWRNLNHADRFALSHALRTQIHQRLNEGQNLHGQTYRGKDPAADLQEELIDGLIYLNWVTSQRDQTKDLLWGIIAQSDNPEIVQELAHEAIAVLQGTE